MEGAPCGHGVDELEQPIEVVAARLLRPLEVGSLALEHVGGGTRQRRGTHLTGRQESKPLLPEPALAAVDVDAQQLLARALAQRGTEPARRPRPGSRDPRAQQHVDQPGGRPGVGHPGVGRDALERPAQTQCLVELRSVLEGR
ncbi:MAG: hypothetical protein P8Y05_11115 [Deinococcales bacterium]